MWSIRLKFLNCAAIFPLNVNVQYTNFSLAEFRGMIEIGGRAGMQNIWRVIARPASRARVYYTRPTLLDLWYFHTVKERVTQDL